MNTALRPLLLLSLLTLTAAVAGCVEGAQPGDIDFRVDSLPDTAPDPNCDLDADGLCDQTCDANDTNCNEQVCETTWYDLHRACRYDTDCPCNTWCEFGECYADCLEDDDCMEGEVCSAGECEPAPPADASAPPDYEDLDGDE